MQPKMIRALSISSGLAAVPDVFSEAPGQLPVTPEDSLGEDITLVASSSPTTQLAEESLAPLERARRKSQLFARKHLWRRSSISLESHMFSCS